MLFRTDSALHSVTEITPALLKRLGVRGLILDIDNTLTTHNNPVVPPTITAWLDSMRSAGVRMIIVSNNKAARVQDFAAEIGLDFVSDAAKPLTFGIENALKALHLCRKHTAVVGDQLFTDVLAAQLAGLKMIYVTPIEPESSLFFKVKRLAEKPFLPKTDD